MFINYEKLYHNKVAFGHSAAVDSFGVISTVFFYFGVISAVETWQICCATLK